jgi:hypothetical protein
MIKTARMIFVTLAFATTSTSTLGTSMSYCSKPFAPSEFLMKPNKPYCAINRSCSQWEVDSYKREVEDYFAKLKQYLVKVDRYYDEAYKYAKCMAELD